VNRPVSLIGKPVHGAYLCERWELRLTSRCLADDLNAAEGANFEAIEGLEIVEAFVAERAGHTHGTRQVNPLSCGREVWVLARGHNHRGATLYDPDDDVVWLVAYGRHRSGEPDDFFPYCKGLDEDKSLLPTAGDYERMYTERDLWFAEAVRVEAPLILQRARSNPGEHRCSVGGALGASLSVEIEGELDAMAMTVAFHVDQVETYEQGVLLLAALYPGAWDPVSRLPSRELDDAEVAFTVMFSSGQPV
jgi:hypothetical protein